VKQEKTMFVTSILEVMLTSLGIIIKDGIEAPVIQDKKHNPLTILRQEDVWICDTRASNHMMWCNRAAVSVHDTLLLSLDHTGDAIETTAMFDIPVQFMP
jgi:hypothetical protein